MLNPLAPSMMRNSRPARQPLLFEQLVAIKILLTSLDLTSKAASLAGHRRQVLVKVGNAQALCASVIGDARPSFKPVLLHLFISV